MGRNGAGKTTLLRAIAGVHEPFRGRVTVDGHAPDPGVDTGMCPQEPESILFAETVADEVRTTLKARGLGTGPEPVLEALGIEDLAERHPRDLSAGQRLLVATAAVAAGRRPAILLDEPTRGLDPDAKDRLGASCAGTRPTAAWRCWPPTTWNSRRRWPPAWSCSRAAR